MKRTMILILTAMAMVLLTCYNSFAVDSIPINITATVPTLVNGINATITSITPGVPGAGSCTGTDTWGASGLGAMAFGNLNWDSTNSIFLPSVYFAVDVGVVDNVATNWQITHTRTNFQNAAGTANLNNKVNVAYMRQTVANPAGTEIAKESYANSNSRVLTRAQISPAGSPPGWLRIYYGFATGRTINAGATACDASGTSPIGLDTPAGTYSGQVTLTYLAL